MFILIYRFLLTLFYHLQLAGRYVQWLTGHTLTDANANVLVDTTVANAATVAYVDNTLPTVSGSTAAVSPSVIQVNFSKTMNSAIGVATNYTIVNEANSNLKGAIGSVEVSADSKIATLILSSPLAAGNYTVTVTGVADSLGNAISTTANTKIGMAVAADSTSATISGVTFVDVDGSHSQTAGDKLKVQFSEPVQIVAGKVLADIFNLDVNADGTGGDTFGGSATVATGSSTSELVVTLGTSPAALTFGTSKLGLIVSGGGLNTAVKDLAGNSTTAPGWSTAIALPAGETAPVIQSAVLADVNNDGKIDAGDKFTMTFDKALATKADWHSDGTEGTMKLDFNDGAGANNVAMTASNTVTSGNTVVYTVATSDVNTLVNGIKVSAASGNTNIVDAWGQSATTAAVAVTFADTTAAKIVGAQFFDGSANAIAGTGDAVVLTFDKAVVAGTVTPTTFTGLGTPGTASFGLVKNIAPTKVLVTFNNATGFATTNTLNLNNLLPNNDIRTIAGISAVTSASPVAITVSNVEAGVTAVASNGVTVTAAVPGAGALAATADALQVGSTIRAYSTTAGAELVTGALEYVVLDTTPADGASDAVAVTNTTLADANLTTVVYLTKDGVVHVVNYAADMSL